MPRLKNLVSNILLAFGYSINSKSKKKLLRDLIHLPEDVGLSPVEACRVYKSSTSQLGQDLLALIASGAKKNGFFVEFGAADGVALSNSFLVEKEFGWSGILCEPSRSWHEDLKKNRSCSIEFRCVYSRTGEQIGFSENYIGELSGITEFTGDDHHGLINRTTHSCLLYTSDAADE